MIISHKHRFIFIAVPKTGTHAIRQALRPILGEDDEEQVGLFKHSLIERPGISELKNGHVSCRQAAASLPPDIWKNYRKFTVTRDPVARFLSFIFFKQGDNPLLCDHPLAHMKAQLLRGVHRRNLWALPQSHFLLDDDDNLMVDDVVRLENFQADFDRVCEQLAIPSTTLGVVNRSEKRREIPALDNELLQLIVDGYRQDYEALGYALPSFSS